MVGGTTPPQSDSGEISRVGPQPSLAKQAVLTHRPGYFCLDNAFALIEGTLVLGMWEKWRHPPPWFLGIWRNGRPAEPTLRLRMPALLTALPEPVPSWLGQWQSG